MPKFCKKKKRKPFNKVVTIQKPKYDNQDDFGKTDLTKSENWEDFIRPFCNVTTQGGGETFQADQVQAEQSHLWTTPSSTKVREITPDMRLVYDGEIHEILYAIDEDEDRRYFIIGTKVKPTYAT